MKRRCLFEQLGPSMITMRRPMVMLGIIAALAMTVGLLAFAWTGVHAAGPEDNNAQNRAVAPPVETFTFPATGDPRSTQSGFNFWNLGDFVQGSRTLVNPANTVDMVLKITNNVLSCDTQDHVFKIDGTSVGNFSVASGNTQVVKTFTFASIAAGSHTFRIENIRTVDGGCGSAGFPNGVSTLTFSNVPAGPVLNPANGHYYEVVEVAAAGIDWFAADAAAASSTFQGLPGHLVTITSQAENEFIANSFADVTFHWMGGFQAPSSPEPAGGWEWVTGEPFVYTNWFPGGPDDLGTVNEDGLEFCCLTGEVLWNDLIRTATGRTGYVVEYEALGPCNLELALSYAAPTLTMDFTVGNLVPVTGSAWLVSQNSAALLGSIALAINDPPISLSFPIPVPVQGGIGVLSTLTTTTEGIICSAWVTIDTSP